MDTRPRVLIVDDTPANIKLLADLLREDYELSVATGGKDALAIALGQDRPDLVLLDIMMPEMDGYEVCRRLKAEEATRDVPVIFVTAMHEVEDETRGFDAGAVDFITKPISPAVVKSRVRSAISLKQKTEELSGLSRKLSRYLSPQVYESIFTGSRDARIGSSRKKLTVFFSDIVGFTNTTERLEAEEMSELLNSYLERMSSIVIKHGGTIDKFMGDAIMVFFGDPESRGEKEDALACVEMAMEMRDSLREFQEEWFAKGIETPFHVRAGINTGYCTVGNFGSAERMEYTIIGGQVNIASRLETSAEPDQILISHETWTLVRDEVFCIRRKPLNLKGIAYPVQTYQVVDYASKMSSEGSGVELGDLVCSTTVFPPDALLREARSFLEGEDAGSIVVADGDGNAVGLICPFGASCLPVEGHGLSARGDVPLADVMAPEPLSMEADAALHVAAKLAAARPGWRAMEDIVVTEKDVIRGVVPVRLLLENMANQIGNGDDNG